MEAKDFDNYPKWSEIYEKLIKITNGKTVYLVEEKWKVASLIRSENYKYSLEHEDLNFMEINFGNRGYMWRIADRTDFRYEDENDIYRSKTACYHFLCVLNHIAENGLSDFIYE